MQMNQFNWDNRFLKAAVYDGGCAFLMLDYQTDQEG
jgi:hypothetical protein